MSQAETRNRTRPEERFASTQAVLDLREQSRDLADEPDSGQAGHRQKALIREGPLTLALYHFQAGSRLPDHVVDGVVLIHTLEGRVRITTEQGSHELPAGCVLRLSSGVRHDLTALDTSRVLLTIALEGPDSQP